MPIGSFKLPAGGAGGTDISDADAAVTDVVASKTFYATSGGRKTGTMTDRGTVSTNITTKDQQVTIEAGKHSGSGIVKLADTEIAKIIAGNIKKDIVILGVTGTVEGGGGATSGDYLVRFIDYDGTILKSEWVNSGNNATAPTTPTHSNLTFQEWNNAFTNVTRNIDVGAIYITTDGKCYLYIRVSVTTGLSPTLYIYKSTTALMTINWGDGGTNSTSSSSGSVTFAKTYAAEGDYVITIACAGNYTFGHGSFNTQIFGAGNYIYILKNVRIGSNVVSLSVYAFYNYLSLYSLTIPSGVTTINRDCFLSCTSLYSLTIPSGVTTINNNICQGNSSIKFFIIPSGVTSFGSGCFSNCYAFEAFKIPSGITSILGSLINNCYSLLSVYIPSGVTSIAANAFSGCTGVVEYVMNPTTPPTLAATSAFTGINMITKIYVPDASVAAYKAATNWSTYANYIYPISTR